MAVDWVANSVCLGELVCARQALHSIREDAVVESDATAGSTESEGRRAADASVGGSVVLLTIDWVGWADAFSTEVVPA